MPEPGHKLYGFSDHDQWIGVKGDGNLQYSRQRGSIDTSLQLADVFGTVPTCKRDVLRVGCRFLRSSKRIRANAALTTGSFLCLRVGRFLAFVAMSGLILKSCRQ